jgi:hypothetical protein
VAALVKVQEISAEEGSSKTLPKSRGVLRLCELSVDLKKAFLNSQNKQNITKRSTL